MTQYEIISICLAAATILFSIVAIVIAIWSSRQATNEVNRLIYDTNRATRANISVEIDKLEVEKFRLSMQMVELEAKKKWLEEKYPNKDQGFLLEPPVREQIKLINEQLERDDKLYKQMSFMQLDMQKILGNCK
ncbi:MAG: hypothetical protein MR794_07415 [Bacteroidales bacterium]|nr:hypothetical protein [Bacteroidales bacterium]